MTDLAELYAAIYADPAFRDYGRGLDRCAPFLPRIWQADLRSVIAFGCGHGDELLAIHKRVPRCLGVDFALPPKVWHADADRSCARIQVALQDLQAAIRYDAVVSFDVLEHLPERDLDLVLLTAMALAPRACLVVANMPDPQRLADGRVIDCHLIQKPPHWWAERIRRITGWTVELQALPYPERFGLWCGAWP